MSTFRGIVKEFPEIRIDYFRADPDHSPPLACFLSHVHSDHLLGLESLKTSFVYCSPATREILLRLEKYPHRMNFTKGILEARQQTYKRQKGIMKTIPLETPTVIELSPGNEIRVTLFNANHCAGAVMFFIQGDGKAILYTGDIRSETWLVNSLVRNPILLPYTLGTQRLDNIYLDTTFATKDDHYRRFPSKSQGLRELLAKVQRYPSDTMFYIEAWTFGYEDVWIALSSLLQSQIHLDPYRWSLYKSLRISDKDMPTCPEAPALSGYQCGNHPKPGCLTSDHQVRLHSCERGAGCPIIGHKDMVQIVPIISRSKDGEMHEMGIGGGKGDLDQVHELEVDNVQAIIALIGLCTSSVKDPDVLSRVMKTLSPALANKRSRILLGNALRDFDDKKDIPLHELVRALGTRSDGNQDISELMAGKGTISGGLPRIITFPYSRHSSYKELCELVAAFKPKDIHPCTVDEATWTPAVGMRTLFGHLCSDDVFAHDQIMLEKKGPRETQTETQITQNTDEAEETDEEQVADDAAYETAPQTLKRPMETNSANEPPSSKRRRSPTPPKVQEPRSSTAEPQWTSRIPSEASLAEEYDVKIIDVPLGTAVPEDVVRQCDERMKVWLADRNRQQVHPPDMHLWQSMEQRQYHYDLDKDGTVVGLIVMKEFPPGPRMRQIKFSLDFPNAPPGTINTLLVHALNMSASAQHKQPRASTKTILPSSTAPQPVSTSVSHLPPLTSAPAPGPSSLPPCAPKQVSRERAPTSSIEPPATQSHKKLAISGWAYLAAAPDQPGLSWADFGGFTCTREQSGTENEEL